MARVRWRGLSRACVWPQVIFDEVMRSVELIKMMEQAEASPSFKRKPQKGSPQMNSHRRISTSMPPKSPAPQCVLSVAAAASGAPKGDGEGHVAAKAAAAPSACPRAATAPGTSTANVRTVSLPSPPRDDAAAAAAGGCAGSQGGSGAVVRQRPKCDAHAHTHAHAHARSVAPTATGSDCCGFDQPLHFLGYTTAAVIGANVALMCAPYRGMAPAYEQGLERASLVFTAYFLLECLTKLLVYGRGNLCGGWKQYFHTREDHQWNRLDFTILALDLGSLVLEHALASISAAGSGTAANPTSFRILRVFRALRVLRAFKLSNVWEPLNNTLQTMYKAAAPVSSLAVLILLFTIMFALLGKELFGGIGLSLAMRTHFDRPLPAVLTVMTIFSGDCALRHLPATSRPIRGTSHPPRTHRLRWATHTHAPMLPPSPHPTFRLAATLLPRRV
jgi:hypothetical protein